MRKVGLFGGSFDPIHKGHIQIALYALKVLKLDEIQLIPTKNNPWKDEDCASEVDRCHMINLAIQDYPQLSLQTIEVDNVSNEKNYTIDTLKALIQNNTDTQYYYIMGMDQANLFYKWKKAKKISQLVQLVAFQRGGYKPDKKEMKEYHFLILDNLPLSMSSSEVRKGHLEMLDPQVLKYISSQGIYLETMVKCRMKDKRWKHTCSVAQLASKIAKANGLNEKQAYIAGMLHDVAKEMDDDQAYHIMEKYFPSYKDKPKAIWHQWVSRYVSEHEFLVDDVVVLKAIEHHTTGSVDISPIGKCLYVADKLDPLRGYDSSVQIATCMKDIHQGFKDELVNFYNFSVKKGRPIDECFYEIYDYFVKKGKI